MSAPMTVFARPASMTAWSDEQRRQGRTIGFVPTMGALHEGHLELMRSARDRADVVVVSIFVNPLQFNRRDDFDNYPTPIDDDLALCRSVGVDAVYAPTAAVMYPSGFQTTVEPGPLADPLEGAGRPGHFRGVTTVVTKLFNAVRPDVAVFGQKDYQQLAIVRRMARDLDTGIEIVAAPTVREPDGLALSSRNRRLTPADRLAAVAVPRCLAAAREAFDAGERDAAALVDAARRVVDAEPAARVEYIGIADADELTPLDDGSIVSPVVMAVAVWFGDVRLIDNQVLAP